MVKKHSEKSKTYEKDRRDRLNFAIGELAKMLPKYDPSVVWSKIEVIQFATSYMMDIKERQKKAIEGYGQQDILDDFHNLIEANMFFQSRHKQLVEILKKSNINPPHFDLPKILKSIPKVTKESFACDFQFKSLKRENDRVIEPPSLKQNQQLPNQKSSSGIVSNDRVTTIPTGVLVPVKVITIPQPVANQTKRVARKRKISQSSTQSCQFVKLYCKRDDGKLPIPTLKRRTVVKKKHKRRRRARKDVNLPPTSIRIESPTANFLMNFPVVKSGGKHDTVDDLHDFLLPSSFKDVNAPSDVFTNTSVITEGKPQIARNLFNVSKQENQPNGASFNCVIVPADTDASIGRGIDKTSYIPLGKPQTSIPLPSFSSTTQGIYSLREEKSIFVSSDKPIVFAEPNNVLVISSKPPQKTHSFSEKSNKSAPKYYFEEPATDFTFNLTNTTNTQPKDTTTPTSYYHKPWIPPPSLYSNSSQPAAFTFSLTPTTNTVATAQSSSATINFTFSLTNTTTTKEVNSTKKVFYDCEKQQKSHVNWMTTADTTTYAQDCSTQLPNPATNSVEENFFYTWSPIKGEKTQPNDFWSTVDIKPSPVKKTLKTSSSSNNQSHTHIFSVSQLVDEGNGQQSKKPSSYSAESLLAKKDKNKNNFYCNNLYNSGTNGGDFSFNSSTSNYTSNFSNFSNPNFENTDYFEFLNPSSSGKATNTTNDWLPLDNYSGNFHPTGSTNWQSTNFFEPLEFNSNHQIQSQQNNSSSTNNISNFNLSSICPEINSEDHQQQHNIVNNHQKIGINSNVW